MALSHIYPLLDDGEHVLARLHVRAHDAHRRGKIAVTPRRCVVHWGAREQADDVAWADLRAWDVQAGGRGGPVLTLETADERIALRLPVVSRTRVRRASALLERIGDLAPAHADGPGFVHDGAGLDVRVERPGLGAYTRRLLVTLIGLAVILAGVLFASPFVPGPGMLTVLAGLAVLAREYDWASDVHQWLQRKVQHFWQRRRQRRAERAQRAPSQVS